MFKPVSCHTEAHAAGGSGRFILSPVEALGGALDGFGGRVRLVYIDPPFGTGDVFSMRGSKIPAYRDDMTPEAYWALMREALIRAKALLSADGSIFVHIDYRVSARMRLLMDEVFGERNFVNEIIWSYRSGGRSTRHFSRKHDNILFYKNGRRHCFNIEPTGIPRGPERRNHMKRTVDESGRICFSIRSGGRTYMYYEDSPVYPSDVWDDIEHLHQKDPERTGYATQKPEALLKRMILCASEQGDIVADLFSGSGTTAAVAAKLDRAYLAVDASPLALMTLRGRLLKDQSETTLLESSRELIIEFPPSATTPFGFEYELCELDGRLTLSRDPGRMIAYMAEGVIDDGVFHTRTAAIAPKEGDSIPLGAAVQLTSIYGEQRFFCYSDCM